MQLPAKAPNVVWCWLGQVGKQGHVEGCPAADEMLTLMDTCPSVPAPCTEATAQHGSHLGLQGNLSRVREGAVCCPQRRGRRQLDPACRKEPSMNPDLTETEDRPGSVAFTL